MLDRNEHWQYIKLIMETFWEPIKESDGNTLQEIEEVEQSLNIRLPVAMREWYLMAGKYWKLLHHDFSQFLLESTQIWDSKYLVFLIEIEGVINWGIRLSDLEQENPLVLATEVDFDETYTEISGTFSAFMLNIISCSTKNYIKSDLLQTIPTDSNALKRVEADFAFLGYSYGHSMNKNKIYYNNAGIIWVTKKTIILLSFSTDGLLQMKKMIGGRK